MVKVDRLTDVLSHDEIVVGKGPLALGSVIVDVVVQTLPHKVQTVELMDFLGVSGAQNEEMLRLTSFDVGGKSTSIFLLDLDVVFGKAESLGVFGRNGNTAVVNSKIFPGGIDFRTSGAAVDVLFQEVALELDVVVADGDVLEEGRSGSFLSEAETCQVALERVSYCRGGEKSGQHAENDAEDDGEPERDSTSAFRGRSEVNVNRLFEQAILVLSRVSWSVQVGVLCVGRHGD